MTWGEFKIFVEKTGVKDGHEIRYIDFSGAPEYVEVAEDGKIIIE